DLFPRAVHDIEKLGWERSQRVRFPDQAVNCDPAAPHGATCVDYALLLCAVLEAFGLQPLLLIVGKNGAGCHALVGCWLGRVSPGTVLIRGAAAAQQYVKTGGLLVVDVTEFSRGKTFQQARELGQDSVLKDQFLYALDIPAARGEPHRVVPLP